MASRNDQVDSIIGKGSAFEGRFNVQGSLKVDGKFEGEVRIEDQLIVGETGKVKTNVVAKKVIVGGTFIGNIVATEEVILLDTGKVLGDIVTPTLTVQKGVIVLGNIQINNNKYDKSGIQEEIENSFEEGPSIPKLMIEHKEI